MRNVINAALYRVVNNLKKFVKSDSAEEKNLQALVNKLSAKQVERLGWEPKAGESNDDQLTRPYVLNAALYAQNEEAIAQAHKIFEANQDNLAGLSADIRLLVLRNEVKHFGNEQLFNNLLSDYVKSADPSYKADLSVAVTSVEDSNLISQLINKFEDAETIKPQDLRAWYRGTLANEKSQQAAWDWIRNDWDWLEKTVGGDMEFSTYITVTSMVFHTPERLAEFKAFFEPKVNTPGLTREIQMDIKIVETNVNLIEAEKDAVNKAITENK